MFSTAVQPGIVSLFSSTGSDPLSLFASHRDASLPSDSFICILNDATSEPTPPPPQKLIDLSDDSEDSSPDYTLDQSVLHIQSPTVRTTYIRCPPAGGSSGSRTSRAGASGHLGLKHPWIHLQVRNMHREWAFEIGLVDQAGREGVIRCATFQVCTLLVGSRTRICARQAAPFAMLSSSNESVYLGMPLSVRRTRRLDKNGCSCEPKLKLGSPPLLALPLTFPPPSSRPLTSWCTIALNLPSLLPHFSSATLASDEQETRAASHARHGQVPSGVYSHVSYVKVYANCRLRRIWFSEGGPQQRLPWEFQLYAAS